jgi:hypothetical protein
VQVKPGEEVETQGRISALLASSLASWRASDNQEPSSPLDQVRPLQLYVYTMFLQAYWVDERHRLFV